MNNEDLKQIEQLLDRKLNPIASDVATLKEDVSGLKEKVSGMEEDISGLKEDVGSLKHEMKVIRVDLLENNVLPRLSTIEKCYVDTSKRYLEGADRFDAAITDIEVMKLAIQKNSSDIKKLQRKQA